MKKSIQIIVSSLLFLSLAACQKKQDTDLLKNFVTEKSEFPRIIGDEKNSFIVTTAASLKLSEVSASTLVLGYPLDLLGQENLFGGTITEVSDHEDVSMGRMKMTSLAPLHVKGFVETNSDGHTFLNLKGCEQDCSERSETKTLFSIPVLSLDTKLGLAYLDLSALGASLNIIQSLATSKEDEDLIAKWHFIGSKTRSFDHSSSTLVMDVVSDYNVGENEKAKMVSLTTRWYLKLSSFSNPYFESRVPTSEVGYFTTSRSKSERIKRFSAISNSSGPIVYYLKNVPAEYRQGIADGFEAWNDKLNSLFGTSILKYIFLESNDPLNQVVVAGDIRFNVLEWDLTNKASYGGLGPSIAHQGTGEILAAQVLIQGPTIEKLYKEWFQIQNDKQMINLEKQISRQARTDKFNIKIGGITAQIPAQLPELQDPLEIRMDFEKPPEGYDYQTYMQGYFRDMIAHELGHNLGLRHNFKGNLGSDLSGKIGSVSRSIMEYLGGSFRHLDTVGEYDVMAIAFGYFGIAPEHKNWFCTDEDSDTDPTMSAECSSSDATPDSFGYFQRILNLALSKSVGLETKTAPDWVAEDLKSKLNSSVTGLARYAASATFTSQTWTRFFDQPERPTKAIEIPRFVLEQMKNSICNPDLDKAALEKENQDAVLKTQENLKEVRNIISEILKDFDKPFPLGTKLNFPCLSFEETK